MPAFMVPHIKFDDRGVAWVDDSNTKVREIVLDELSHGWTPKEIHLNHPHLSLAQIHAALAYYYDHKSEIDREIEDCLQKVEDLKAAAGDSAVRKRLKSLGRL
jgi:uncharacterized protein (DUF433 family)